VIKVTAYKPAFQTDWKALLRKLPKDAAGGIDWVKALDDGDIDPLAGIDPEHAQMQPVMQLDVHLEPPAMPLFKVTFPHKPHTEWLACDNCHPKIFQMKAGADPITMGKIFAGEYCGECHGKVAFDVATGCPRCHLALAGPQ
jgi:c(7)-type cytochrome triheme protein